MPKLGIFWYYQSNFLQYSTALNEADDDGLFLNCPLSHDAYWDATLRHLHPELKSFNYFDFPRGRVLYSKRAAQYWIYLDRVLMKRERMSAILTAFDLPAESSRFKRDAHYTTERRLVKKLFEN